MRGRNVAALIAFTLLSPFPALAANFPKQADICVGGIVSKEKLSKSILKQNADWQRLYIDANDGPTSDPKYRPQWRKSSPIPNSVRTILVASVRLYPTGPASTGQPER